MTATAEGTHRLTDDEIGAVAEAVVAGPHGEPGRLTPRSTADLHHDRRRSHAVAMQFYASPEQIMRDRSEYARKGIARGRSVVVLTYAGGVLFVAENLSTALHKVSEIYDRIGFAAVGRYNEFENLRAAGVRMADLRGYSYDRRDVTGRALANAYAQTLGAIFTEQPKPFEVEICVAEVGATPADDELYRLTYDGSVDDEPASWRWAARPRRSPRVLKRAAPTRHALAEALAAGRQGARQRRRRGRRQPRSSPPSQLEVAVLDRTRTGRAFRRITGAALTALLDGGKDVPEKEVGEAGDAAPPAPGEQKPAGRPPRRTWRGVSDAGDKTGDEVNGDGS